MKKLLVGLIATTLLLVLPGAGAGASRGSASDTATASAGFLRIGGARRLPARKKLRVPIRCSVRCRVATRSVLVLAGPDLPPLRSATVLTPGVPRDLILTLNGAATRSLKAHIGAARLKVRATARNLESGGRAGAFKVFRFKS